MNKWMDYIRTGGMMPDITEDWPEVPDPNINEVED
jgi:hypothetical protein